MFEIEVEPDYEALLANLRREGTPRRVHNIELFWDEEVGEAIAARFDLTRELDPADPDYWRRRNLRLHRFLGYDYVLAGLTTDLTPLVEGRLEADDTATLTRYKRKWMPESAGPIQTWEDFEKFPWEAFAATDTREIEWYSKHTPEDMCLLAGCHNVFEFVTWAMGYEKLCFALYDQPDLVDALFRKVGELLVGWCKILLQFDRIKLFFGGDDMGFKTSTMISAEILKEKALVWHKRMAELCHQQGRLYCLHSCGKLDEIMEALIEEVKLDSRHSFEDAIEPVTIAKRRWGKRLSLLGGMDVDFLCRATPEQVRRRVRETLDICLPGGGYCLGTGNTVTNYIPLENYLVMLDEGRRYGA